MNPASIIYVYSVSDDFHQGAVRVTSSPADGRLSAFLPANCDVLRAIAANRMKEGEGCLAVKAVLHHAELSTWFDSTGQHDIHEKDVHRLLSDAGVVRRTIRGTTVQRDWFECTPLVAIEAIRSLKTVSTSKSEKTSSAGKKAHRRPRKARQGHGAADALDWKEAMSLIESLREDGRWRDSLLVGSGCFLGLRISDLLELRWTDLLGKDRLELTEKKTGKLRRVKINPVYRDLIRECREQCFVESDGEYVFRNPDDGGRHISRQRADQILKECKERYHLTSAATFSTHSLRKTFGRRVWLRQCEKGKGDQALLLLCDVFGHSSISITKRYLGIRQDEILSVYDNL